ncbi:unnamed protein product, partial [Symbiodinium sp. KB8]
MLMHPLLWHRPLSQRALPLAVSWGTEPYDNLGLLRRSGSHTRLTLKRWVDSELCKLMEMPSHVATEESSATPPDIAEILASLAWFSEQYNLSDGATRPLSGLLKLWWDGQLAMVSDRCQYLAEFSAYRQFSWALMLQR